MSQLARCATHRDAEAEASCVRCGDFVCRLCTPLEPVAMCNRCVVRATVDWEERGELGISRAFWNTLRAGLAGPFSLGRRLGGAGHLVHALQFVFLCGVCGLLPLSIAGAVPLLTWADAPRLGLHSTGLLGTAVSLVPASLVFSTLLSLGVAVYAGWLWALCRMLQIAVRYDVLVRATAYGLSPLAIPVLGPLLLPVGLFWSGLALYGALSARGQTARALSGLLLSMGGWAVIGVVAVWWW
ncbi:MAG: hypothetical protein QM778_13300 [Myxococcales bacterium]